MCLSEYIKVLARLGQNVEIEENPSFIKQAGKTVTEDKVLFKTLAYSSLPFGKKPSLCFKVQFSTTVTTANIFPVYPSYFLLLRILFLCSD